jgi:hypothetical protein
MYHKKTQEDGVGECSNGISTPKGLGDGRGFGESLAFTQSPQILFWHNRVVWWRVFNQDKK